MCLAWPCLHRSSGRPVICADATTAIAPHSLQVTSRGSLDRSIMMARFACIFHQATISIDSLYALRCARARICHSPSLMISCTQLGPVGGASRSTGWAGTMNPAGNLSRNVIVRGLVGHRPQQGNGPICSACRTGTKNTPPANLRGAGYVSAPTGHTRIPGPFLARRPGGGQSFQKFLNRPGASAVHLWVETMDRWPR